MVAPPPPDPLPGVGVGDVVGEGAEFCGTGTRLLTTLFGAGFTAGTGFTYATLWELGLGAAVGAGVGLGVDVGFGVGVGVLATGASSVIAEPFGNTCLCTDKLAFTCAPSPHRPATQTSPTSPSRGSLVIIGCFLGFRLVAMFLFYPCA